MVVFICEVCNATLKKNQVDKHCFKCRSCQSVTCVDCSVTFWGNGIFNFSNACTYISLRCASLKIWLYALCTSGVRIVETAGRPPNEFISRFKEKDIKIIHKCVTTRHAKSAEKSGVDAISLDGFECAGHPGEEVIPTTLPYHYHYFTQIYQL